MYDENGNDIEAQNTSVLLGDGGNQKQRVAPPPPIYTGQPPAAAMSTPATPKPTYTQPSTDRSVPPAKSSSNSNEVPQLF